MVAMSVSHAVARNSVFLPPSSQCFLGFGEGDIDALFRVEHECDVILKVPFSHIVNKFLK